VLQTFDRGRYPAQRLREHAEQYAPDRFRERFRAIVDRVVAERA
jgi:hypothetical protein